MNYGRELEKKDIYTKIQKLLAILNSSEFADRKFIIFTQYVKTLEIIKKALGGKDYTAEIQGSINVDDRKNQIEKFKDKVRSWFARKQEEKELTFSFLIMLSILTCLGILQDCSKGLAVFGVTGKTRKLTVLIFLLQIQFQTSEFLKV